MIRSLENCGWTIPRKRGVFYCGRRKCDIEFYNQRPLGCPCRHWVRRLRIDRLRGKK